MALKAPIRKLSINKKEERYNFILFFLFSHIKKIQSGIKNVDKTMNGREIPSTPNENFKFSLLNQLKELTNWKWGIVWSKLIGIYKDNKKLIIEVHKAERFAAFVFPSSTDINTKIIPKIGIKISIGRIGKLNIF